MHYPFDTKNGVASAPTFWVILGFVLHRIFCIQSPKIRTSCLLRILTFSAKSGTVLGKWGHVDTLPYSKLTAIALRPSEVLISNTINDILISPLEVFCYFKYILCLIFSMVEFPPHAPH